VVIDRMHSQREIVIKNLGSHLRQVKGVAGATVMGDGSVVPILDLEDLLSAAPVLRQPAGTQREKDRRKALDIMVVDDSVSVRMVVSRLMQRQGWRVQTANDGVDAIEKLRHQKPDLILLDVEMPRMNGYEFMRAFHSQQNLQGIPVVMLTSRSAKKHRDKARSLGVNGYVVKPYEDEALIDMIRQMVAKG
jgi:chemosensory pili system protein ChpA (sensor histidine kinase/response regulator)